MTIEEQITIFEHNAEHERKEGDLHNSLHFRQLVEWLKELKAHREAWELLKEDVMSKYYTYKINMDGHSMEMMEEILGLIYAHRPKEGDGNANSD